MKKYKINDSPEFKNKKTLQKWINIHVKPDSIKSGAVYTDGVIQLYVTDIRVLNAILNSEDDNG